MAGEVFAVDVLWQRFDERVVNGLALAEGFLGLLTRGDLPGELLVCTRKLGRPRGDDGGDACSATGDGDEVGGCDSGEEQRCEQHTPGEPGAPLGGELRGGGADERPIAPGHRNG